MYKRQSEAKTALPNAEISVMDADQKVIFKGKSDEQGNLKIGKLPDGQYFYQETKAPEGCVLDSTIYEPVSYTHLFFLSMQRFSARWLYFLVKFYIYQFP